jgi:F-type H+-transporting ATPase subunit delta
MAGGALARRYARALFGLGDETGSAADFLAQVDGLTQLIEESHELQRAVFTPLHPRAERRGVIAELAERLGLAPEVRAFAMLLVDENRTQHMPQIRDELRTLVERAAGRVAALVTSARPLDEPQVERVRAALAQRVGAEVRVELEVDESLIGGLVARVGDLLLDGSVRTQLLSLAVSLRKDSA